jgi:hypothetical protein
MEWLNDFLPNNMERAGIWLGAICTLALYSILYRENPVYRFFEHMFIGLSAGYSLGPLLVDILYKYWWTPINEGQWWWAFAVPFGLWLYFIYSEKFGWVSRIVIGVLIGASAGLFFQEFSSRFIPQVYSSFKPLIPSAANPNLLWSGAINNLIFIVVLMSVLTYFLFSFEQKGPVRRTAVFGRWMLMIALGAIFGNTVMARMALLIGRVYYLLHDWLLMLRS